MPNMPIGGDKIYSSRDHVNIVWPYCSRSIDTMNHHFKPVTSRYKQESIEDYLRRNVYDVIARMAPNWYRKYPNMVVTIRGYPHMERGEYQWTAWSESP